MTIIKKRTIILKLGGSIVTQKGRSGVFVRRQLIADIARRLSNIINEQPDLNIILVHGVGSAGHQPAKQYALENGVNGDEKKLKGALKTRLACQKLNLDIINIFNFNGLNATSIHTGSAILQKNGAISQFKTNLVESALRNNCIPVMYGEVVFDDSTGMSICSGDVITSYLAYEFMAEKIIYASDIDGIFDCDPHVNKGAKLINQISWAGALDLSNTTLTGSHNVDVTGGLKNKITANNNQPIHHELKKIIICNGLKPVTISQAFSDNESGTIIRI
ncbi:hypothetical protein HGB24_03275 [Candidatus Saccharibacteria bacterium]|nr:hypothetical protein [Candidatus Saccharibacteria bacterium]